LAKVLAHRVWTDLRRGWRYTNPSLSILKLIDVEFVGLDDIAGDAESLMAILPDLGGLDFDARRKALKLIAPRLETRHGAAQSFALPIRRRADCQLRTFLSFGWRQARKRFFVPR